MSTSGRHLELVVQLVRRGRAPDRVIRPADLRDVAEVEDRQPIPRLGDLAAATLPHRPDVSLERVEVAQRRRPEDRRAENEVPGGEHGVVGVVHVALREANDEVARVHRRAARGREAHRVSRSAVGEAPSRGPGWGEPPRPAVGRRRGPATRPVRGRARHRARDRALRAPPPTATAHQPHRSARGRGRSSRQRVYRWRAARVRSCEDPPMSRLQTKSIGEPDELRRFPNGQLEIYGMDDVVIGRTLFEPGWRWSVDVQADRRHRLMPVPPPRCLRSWSPWGPDRRRRDDGGRSRHGLRHPARA